MCLKSVIEIPWKLDEEMWIKCPDMSTIYTNYI